MANRHSSGDWQLKQPVAMALPTVILKAGCLRNWAFGFLSGHVAGCRDSVKISYLGWPAWRDGNEFSNTLLEAVSLESRAKRERRAQTAAPHRAERQDGTPLDRICQASVIAVAVFHNRSRVGGGSDMPQVTGVWH